MNTSRHSVAPEEIMAFLDGEVSVSETQTIAAHIEHCADCSAIATQFRSTSKSLSDWKVEAVPTEFEHPVANLAARTLTGPKDSDAGKFAHVGSWHWNGWAIGAGVIAGVLLLVAVTSPNLLRSRMVANEASAVGSLRALITALAGYSSAYGHFPPSLVNLGPPSDGRVNENAADLIDSQLASGRKSGYVFMYHRVLADSLSRKAGYTINANPTEPRKTGSRAFFTDQTGVIRIVGGGSLDGPSESQPFGSGSAPNHESPKSFVDSDPFIVRNVELSLIVQAISETRSRLDQVLKQHKRYIGKLSASAEDGSGRTLDASLRVPADQLDTSVADLRKLGRVTHESQAGDEVTQQHIDLAARLKNSRNTETRLNDVLHKSNGQTKDILEVERESARVRGEIELMEAERKELEHRVEFGTINIRITEEYKAPLTSSGDAVSTRVHNAFVSGYHNASETLLGFLLFFAEYAPTLLIWLLVLLLPLILIWRRYRRALAAV